MENKHNVRQRRLEKIRKLQESPSGKDSGKAPRHRQSSELLPFGNPSSEVVPAPDILPLARRDQEFDDRWNDPEYVWKQKMQRELQLPGAYYARRSGATDTGDGDGGGYHPRIPYRIRFLRQLVASAMLFGLIWGMFQLQHPLIERGKGIVTTALREPLDFQQLSAWYQKTFAGAPSFIPAFHSDEENPAVKADAQKRSYFVPLKGKIHETYTADKPFVSVAAEPHTPVYALDAGQVTFAGPKDETGYTIIIRHPGGLQSEYGQIEQSRVEVNDWIKGGEAIGQVSRDSKSDKGLLYFAVQKESRYVDPAGVIPFE
ncbi:peptidoglycan DD-metalloendopeptidase family protein [Paenibacillus chitinolyticus]|uniref:peptidoglycan DD-metalloendopeptidase family protein n=1 Tax=Paenibacillus chitinolyticus TaxID=79263 RepID=UPI003CFC5165